MKRRAYIYQILCTETGQCYIGQTGDMDRRKRTHYRELRSNTHPNPKLQEAWNTYGSHAFKYNYWVFTIEKQSELDQLECEYIEKFDAINNGFNIAEGGGEIPSNQKVRNDDIVDFLCVYEKYGEGYGYRIEKFFHWPSGTASYAAKGLRYKEAQEIFNALPPDERESRANKLIEQVGE